MRPPAQVSYDEVASELPLLVATSPVWARLAADNLPAFLADHAVCEQQVAQYALALAGWYPDDFELVEAAANLCLLYTSPSPRDRTRSRMPSSA